MGHPVDEMEQMLSTNRRYLNRRILRGFNDVGTNHIVLLIIIQQVYMKNAWNFTIGNYVLEMRCRTLRYDV